jgi:5-oxoprolinase (ATP-hydrolysing)
MTAKSIYKLNIDTGGTFTDCIASNPDGVTIRRKVLSSSSLRGNITKIISQSELEISTSWSLEKDLLKGYFFRLLDIDHDILTIRSFNPDKRLIKLDKPPEK